MALPKQAREQIKQAQEITDAMQVDADTREGKKQTEIDEFITGLDAEAPPETVEETPAVTPEPAKRTDWKQKYNVLQGKYDAEVPRLHEQVKALGVKVQELQATPATPKPVTPEVPTEFIKPEELEEYGPDLLDVVGRKAREIVEVEYRPVIKGLETQITSLQSQLAGTGQRVELQEQNQVFAQLDRDIENWRETNKDSAFKEWMSGVDPFSGRTRQALMMEAFEGRDVERVKTFFQRFEQENAAVSSNGAAGEPSTGEPTLNLENYVAPSATAGGTQQQGAPQQKRIWAQSEIAKFYSDVQKGHYQKRPDDRKRIDREIGIAVSENRVR